MAIHITSVGRSDIRLLQQLSADTFRETFAESNTEADMNRYLQENMSEEKLLQEWETEGAAFYFVYSEAELAGYLKTNTGKAQTELKLENSLEIERIYVLGKYQGMQIGRKLMAHALDKAAAQNREFVWLGVWEHNHKAIRFYEQYGFAIFDRHIFRLGDDEQTDVLMKIALS